MRDWGRWRLCAAQCQPLCVRDGAVWTGHACHEDQRTTLCRPC